jgi:predicted nucleotidyltransferase
MLGGSAFAHPFPRKSTMTVDQKSIRTAIHVLLNQAPDGSKVILFGSYAKDAAKPSSDIDFLVVEPFVADRFREVARLRIAVHDVLREFMVPVDILVLSQTEFERWRHAPNTIYHRADNEGQVHERVALAWAETRLEEQ